MGCTVLPAFLRHNAEELTDVDLSSAVCHLSTLKPSPSPSIMDVSLPAYSSAFCRQIKNSGSNSELMDRTPGANVSFIDVHD